MDVEVAAGCLLAIGLFVVLSLIGTIPVYFLWNWLVPSIFSLREITFVEALGLSLLFSFLFKSHNSTSSSKA